MTISPTAGYYPLPTPTSASNLPKQLSVAGRLLNAESQDPDAATVSLSPTAQSILAASGSGTNPFALSGAQQQQITQILANYTNAPLTQDTFNKIQDDLHAIGLAPGQLEGKELTTSFNLNSELVSAFNGDAITGGPAVIDEQDKVQSYLGNIYNQLQSLQTQSASTANTAISA